MPVISQPSRAAIGCLLLLVFGIPPARPQSLRESNSGSGNSDLLSIAAAEAKRGVYVFYTQSYIDKENKRAAYKGSVYGALEDVKLNGCELRIETSIVDRFSGTVGGVPTGELQDSYHYVVTFLLTREIADAVSLFQARPAQLGQHTNSACEDNSSCAFTWLRIQARQPAMHQTITLNGALNFQGPVNHFLIPFSSPAAGNQLIQQIRAFADSRCE